MALDRGQAVFEYDASFVDEPLPIQPLWKPPVAGVIRAREPSAFGGLHGLFGDSLPDAWGHEIMRRRAAERGIAYAELSALDRLALVGSAGVGALVYDPDESERTDADVDIDTLARGAAKVLAGADSDVVEALARLGGSSGGGRPKIFVARNSAGHMIAGTSIVPRGYRHWLVKFKSRNDVADIGPLEAAYADMARSAGLVVMPTVLIPAKAGPGYFATERFDRVGETTRAHVLSVAAMLDTDWNSPTIDYATLHRLVRHVTKSNDAVEQMFRRMTFNVLANNRDDHTKQHVFRMQRDGRWLLAPAYDLTLSGGPSGEHYLAVNGRGRDITDDDLLAVAREASVRPARARSIITDVRAAVAGFRGFTGAYDVSRATIRVVERALRA